MRTLMTTSFALALVLVAGAVFAQEHAEVEAAVDAIASKYMEGWNAGDAAMCAAIYTDDADSVDLYGNMFEGRAAIQESIAETLEQYSGTTLDLQRTSLQIVNDDLVVSDGTWAVEGSTAEGVPTQGFYTIILTKSGDEWLIRSGRAKVAPPMPTE